MQYMLIYVWVFINIEDHESVHEFKIRCTLQWNKNLMTNILLYIKWKVMIIN